MIQDGADVSLLRPTMPEWRATKSARQVETGILVAQLRHNCRTIKPSKTQSTKSRAIRAITPSVESTRQLVEAQCDRSLTSMAFHQRRLEEQRTVKANPASDIPLLNGRSAFFVSNGPVRASRLHGSSLTEHSRPPPPMPPSPRQNDGVAPNRLRICFPGEAEALMTIRSPVLTPDQVTTLHRLSQRRKDTTIRSYWDALRERALLRGLQ